MMRRAWYAIPDLLRYQLTLVVLFMLFFSLQRGVLVLIHLDLVNNTNRHLLWYGMLNRGLLFDVVSTTYVLILPAVILVVLFLTGKESKAVRITADVFLAVFAVLAFAVAVADIPYFGYYSARVNRVILAWTDEPGLMLEALFSNVYYLPFILLFFALIFFAVRKLFRFSARFSVSSCRGRRLPWWKRIIWSVFALFFLFLGLRGDYDPAGTPLQVKHAFETNSPLINLLGINPLFNFLHTFTDFDIDYLPDEKVIANARSYLRVQDSFENPVAREITFSGSPKKMNVVLVMLESMYAGQMAAFGNPLGLSPVLDSLAEQGLLFTHCFAAGLHTYNGVFSIFYGLPALMQNKPTQSTETMGKRYAGLPVSLKENGYQTIFFVTGEKEFDNFGGMFPHNGIDRMIDQAAYPKKDRINNWGVPDHVMYDHALPYLDSLAGNGAPFFAAFMTVSTHSPYSVPDGIAFKPTAESARDKSYQYADWAMGRFLREISRKPWFTNTLFIFTGDHGQVFDPLYDIPLSYHHIPLVFWAPGTIRPEKDDRFALQMDVFPTVMGLLRLPYVNRTLGIDLRKETRPFAYFSADFKLGVLSRDYFLIIDKSGHESMHLYREKSLVNVLPQQPHLADSMRNYTYTMLQMTQYLIRKNLTNVP